jgi:hypothetical protein
LSVGALPYGRQNIQVCTSFTFVVANIIWCVFIGPGVTRGRLRPAKGDRVVFGFHSSVSSSTGGVTSPKVCSSLCVLAMKRSRGLIHFWLLSWFLRWLAWGPISLRSVSRCLAYFGQVSKKWWTVSSRW